MNQNAKAPRIVLSNAERIAVAMLTAAASQAASRLQSTVLCRIMDALNYMESGDVDGAVESLARPIR